MAKTVPPLVICIWQDHVSNDSWLDKEDAGNERLPEIRSVGWLIKETEEAYYLVGDHDEGYVQVSRLMVVGKRLLKSMKVLRKGKSANANRRIKKAVTDNDSGPAVPA